MPELVPAPTNVGESTVTAGRDVIIGGDYVGGSKTTFIIEDQAYNVQGLKNPYLGLRSFTYDERALYAGREELVAETLAKLVDPAHRRSVLFVTGQSGSGKSSFAQAGLLPALVKHYAQYAGSFAHAVLRPGAHPIAALRDAGQRLCAAGRPTVAALVIDQFEELFLQSVPEERRAFLRWLTCRRPFAQAPLHVILTLRSDYLSELFEIPALWEMARGGVDLRALSRDDLRAAISHPVQAMHAALNKTLEPALLARLIEDVAGHAGYLPLLQLTLNDLWERGRLSLSAYGSLTDAVRQRAEKVYHYVDFDAAAPGVIRSEAERAALLELCLSLVSVSPDDDQRRDVRVHRLLTELAPEQRRLIPELSRARLLSLDKDAGAETVSLIHETLIGNWDRLREAVKARRTQLQRRSRFEQQLRLWLAQDEADEYALTGIQLAEARALQTAGDVALRPTAARKLLERSLALAESRHQRELEIERRSRRGWQTVVVILSMIVAAFATWLGYREYLRVSARLAGAPQSVAGAAFRLESREVTVRRYRQCVEAGACSEPARLLPTGSSTYFEAGADNRPVTGVDALQAAGFCQWTGRRLPRFDEWELATGWPVDTAQLNARAANLALSDSVDIGPQDTALFAERSSADGISDLIGNVWEFTTTYWSEEQMQPGAEWWDGLPAHVTARLTLVGGSFRTDRSGLTPTPIHAAYRDADIGFRCAEGGEP